MRNLVGFIVMACTSLLAMPASAQSAGEILSSVNGTRYDNCRYLDGVYRTTCQLERVTRVADTFRSSQRQSDYRQGDRLERQIAMFNALERACNAGDQHSCTRLGGGIDARRIEAARALMDACRNGDRFSCDRADNVLTGRDAAYASRRAAAPQAARPAPRQTDEVPAYDLPERVTRDQVRTNGSREPQRVSWTQVLMGGCLVDIDPRTGARTSGFYDCR